jgi:indole-3-glycerol phosphate synthase
VSPGSNGRRSVAEALSEDRLALIVEPLPSAHADLAAIVAECEQGGAVALSLPIDGADSEAPGGTWDAASVAQARAECELPIVVRATVRDVQGADSLVSTGADAAMVLVEPLLDGDDEEPLPLVHVAELLTSSGVELIATVRTPEELTAVLELDVDVVLNIDNRSDDGTIDPERTLDLLADVPVGTPVISESVARSDDVARLKRAGVDALLLDEGHFDAGLTTALAVFGDLIGA